jgi:hypothetical protein
MTLRSCGFNSIGAPPTAWSEHAQPVTDSVFVIDVPIPGNPAEFSIQVAPVKVDGKLVEIPAVQAGCLHHNNPEAYKST